jgi:hypothetical protein
MYMYTAGQYSFEFHGHCCEARSNSGNGYLANTRFDQGASTAVHHEQLSDPF